MKTKHRLLKYSRRPKQRHAVGQAENETLDMRFGALADQIPGLIWITEPDGRCVYLSRSWYEFTGHSPDTGLGFGWLGALHPDDQEATAQQYHSDHLTRKPFRLEYRLLHNTGTYRWVIDSAQPRLSSTGEFLGYMGLVVDISERKAAEDALRTVQQRLELAQQTARIGVWDWDIRANKASVTGYYHSLLGLDPSDDGPSLQTWIDCLHPDDRQRARAEVEEALDGKGSYLTNYRVVHADGSVLHLHSRAELFFDAQGRASRMIGALVDITDNRNSAKALEETETKYRTLFNSIDEGFCICELLLDEQGNPCDYRFLEVNATFEGHTGLHEPVGKTALELVPNLERHWIETYGKVALTGTPYRFIQGSDALGRWFDVYTFRFGLPENLQFGILFTDITQRRKAESQLREREQRLAIATSAAKLGVFEWNVAEDKPKWENDRMFQIFGMAPEQGALTLKQFLEHFIYSEDIPPFEQALNEALRELTIFHATCRIRRASDGATRWINFDGNFEVDAESQSVCLIGVVGDITEQVDREQELAEERANLQHILNSIPVMIALDDSLSDAVYFNEEFQQVLGWTSKDFRRQDMGQHLWPDSQYRALVIAEFAAAPNDWHDLIVTAKDGSTIESSWASLKLSDGRQVSIGIDLRDRKKAERRAKHLQDLAALLSSAVSQDEVTSIVLRQAAKSVGASGGVIALVANDQSHLGIVSSFGYPDWVVEKWQQIPLDHPTAPLAHAIRNRRALWLGSSTERDRVLPITPGLASAEQHEAWAVIPFNIHNKLVGAVSLGFNTQKTFDSGEKAFLNTLTDYCAQALDRARLTEQARAMAALEERQRLARDLHDAVSQVLFASTSMAEAIPSLWERNPDRGIQYLQDVVTLNRGAWAEMRKLLLELRPEAIVRSPFPQLLDHLARAAQAQKSVEIELETDMDQDGFLPADVHSALYRIAQEAFNNIIKHSQAHRVSVTCHYLHGKFALTIEDNGKGFHVEQAPAGLGINNMRERASAIGAHLHITSRPGHGTHIHLTWSGDLDTH